MVRRESIITLAVLETGRLPSKGLQLEFNALGIFKRLAFFSIFSRRLANHVVSYAPDRFSRDIEGFPQPCGTSIFEE